MGGSKPWQRLCGEKNMRVRALIFQNELQMRDLGCFRGLDVLWASL